MRSGRLHWPVIIRDSIHAFLLFPRCLPPAGAPLAGVLMNQAARTWRYRLAVASRALAAIGGGYALSALAATLLAVCLPLARLEASVTATLLSFVVFCCAVLWVFAARSAWHAWAGILLPAAVLGISLWLHGGPA